MTVDTEIQKPALVVNSYVGVWRAGDGTVVAGWSSDVDGKRKQSGGAGRRNGTLLGHFVVRGLLILDTSLSLAECVLIARPAMVASNSSRMDVNEHSS